MHDEITKGRKRKNVIITRIDDAEYQELRARVSESGLTQQSYIVNSALTAHVSSAEEITEMKNKNEILMDYDKQLRGIATNINQLAHTANGTGEIPTVDVLMDILSEVKEFRKEVNKSWRLTRSSITEQRVAPQNTQQYETA